MCSYNTPSMLFPPIELLYLAAIAREWHGVNVQLLDAIAENKSYTDTKEYIEKLVPDMLVCLTGFEIFEEDVKVIHQL